MFHNWFGSPPKLLKCSTSATVQVMFHLVFTRQWNGYCVANWECLYIHHQSKVQPGFEVSVANVFECFVLLIIDMFCLYFLALSMYVFIPAHVPRRWTAGSFLSNWALWGSLQELYSFLRRWAAAYWKLQTPQNDWKGEFCKSKTGKAHPDWQRGKVLWV